MQLRTRQDRSTRKGATTVNFDPLATVQSYGNERAAPITIIDDDPQLNLYPLRSCILVIELGI